MITALLLLFLPIQAPEAPCLTVPCRVVEVYDGDTVTVEVTIRARVRLTDCWAPELHEPGGIASKEYLQRLAEGKRGLLAVPLHERLDKSFSFGRLLGKVQVGGGDCSAAQVAAGHATATKGQ